MLKCEGLDLAGVGGFIFDCYNTLIDIYTDEDSIGTYIPISRWLIYQGVKISPEELMNAYRATIKEEMERKWEKYPEVRVEDIFARICRQNAVWDIDEDALGAATARTFRSASLRKLEVLQNSLRLLKEMNEYPMAIVSNGQRVFSELELKYLSLDKYFRFVLFSSDFGHKKPDPRIFLAAAKRLELEPENIMCIGDSFENDVVPAAKLGMKAMHIEEAWKRFYTI